MIKSTNAAYAILSVILFCNVGCTINKPVIAVIGTGYVGLVTGTCLAHLGNNVICADIDQEKINALNNGVVLMYEPGLKELLDESVLKNQLQFTHDSANAAQQADIIFIAVDTPMQSDGTANMAYLESALQTIAPTLTKHKVLCIKSTVPIGTTDYVQQLLMSWGVEKHAFSLVMNPEFLREGSAVQDFLHPDRIVIGSRSYQAAQQIKSLYEPLLTSNTPCTIVDPATAETIKYASNSFLAVKISFINEIANLCEQTGADICAVSHAMGLDKRIGPYFLKHGAGFGGSCFPKDCNALLHNAKKWGVSLPTLSACLLTNEEQRKKPVKKLLDFMPNLHNKSVTVLGLAFKAGTNDVRNSCAITTIDLLLQQGAHIKAYDPVANTNMKQLFPRIDYCNCLEDAIDQTDAIIIMTDWPEFKQLENISKKSSAHDLIIIDACNIIDCSKLETKKIIVGKMGKKYEAMDNRRMCN
ncbi:UDP-glucose 6-dehydrogenase TuaD [Candidatus Dependentiae bacterium Noda2021]|nr:UDP-glucose 6-dehydrogenase TuaD [Candidatus Dependentiae bacterium Noda2021]